MLTIVAVHVVAAALPPPALAAARGKHDTTEPLGYLPPVDAEVVDPFRPPPHRYGPGNRGLDYATEPGTPVRAAARGVVAFAGQVGGGLHVTVLHPDGVRTTYSFLRSVAVRRGERVEQGHVLGETGELLHLGARVGDEYVDPRSLFAGGRGRARLVPDHELRPAALATEQRLVRDLLRRLGHAAAVGARAAVDVAADAARQEVGRLARGHRELAEWLAYVGELSPAAWVQLGVELARPESTTPCTPSERAPPPVAGRRLLVLVGGLGSSSASAGVDAVDAQALGYARSDVHRFSYRGGTVAERAYRARDSGNDLAEAGRRLARLLGRLAAEHPGVPIDVVAHSQGGLVARAALVRARAPAAVRTLVTLGTPHQGADLAASVLLARGGRTGRAGEDLVRSLRLTELDGDAPALGQLVPGSAFLRDLAHRPLPPHVQVTSVAARADVVVASPRSRLPGADNVVVTVGGVHDHAALPGSPAAQREIALAVARLPPTCRSRADAAVDALAGRAVLHEQRLAGPALRLGLPLRPAR
ncbi:MAG TPA: peptidoglycan DD-metalloendopeptidase family protein [Acidimicrobiales bacterium]|nr:peptidoglycan DD-metalloendopeptidase family protein [Acidimicrobiales bacterium]